MDAVACLPSDAQAAEPVRMGESALYDPALGTLAGAVLGATAGDQCFHPEIPGRAAVLVVVVAEVAQHHVRAAPEPAALAPHRLHGLEQWDELGDIVAVATGESGGGWNADGIGDQMVFAGGSFLADGASSGLGSPYSRPDAGAVDRRQGEVQGVRTAEFGQEGLVQPGQHPGFGPLGQAAPAGHARAEAVFRRQGFPGDPGVQHEQDVLEHSRSGCRSRP